MRKFFLLLAITLTTNAFCQDLSTEITVDRTVVPRLDPASPMQSVQPAVLPTDAPQVRLDPDDLTAVPPYEPQPGFTANPADPNAASSPYRGYVLAGYAPAHNYAIRAGYSFIKKQHTSLDAHLGMRGYSYKGWSDFAGAKTTLMRPYAEIDFFHAFRPTTLLEIRAGGSYDRLSDSPKIGADIHHGIGRANLDGRFSARIHRYKLFSDLKINHIQLSDPLNVNPDAYSTTFDLSGSLTPASGTGWDIALQMAAQLRRGRPQFSEIFGRNTCAIIGLTPGYSFKAANINFHAGVRLDGTFGAGEGAFHVAPRLEATTMLTRGIHARLDVAGGEYFNSPARCYAYSPWAVQNTLFANSYSPVDAKLELTFGPTDWGTLSIFGRYDRTNDVPMPMIMRQTMTWERVNLYGFSGGAKIKLTPAKWLSAEADATFTPEGLHQGTPDNIDRARFLVNASITTTPMSGLHIGISYHLRASRAFYVTDPQSTYRSPLGNISDLRLHAGYRVLDPLTVFIAVDNILNRTPELLPGLKNRGIHGLLGAIYQF